MVHGKALRQRNEPRTPSGLEAGTSAPRRFAFHRAAIQNAVVATAEYKLVRLSNGTHTVYSPNYGEKMHPGLGPQAEADLLYVQQLKIRERMREGGGEFVVWDVGLGAAANAIAVLCATRAVERPLRLVSFDDTSAPLEFALTKVEELGYFQGYETTAEALQQQRAITFQNGRSRVTWEFHLGDFPSLLESKSAIGNRKSQMSPHAILFDAFSPAKNPAMWTLPLFTNLFRVLDPARPCNLTTYSRSTMLRVTLLLAGFYVGRGIPTGLKEETTVAANTLELIDEPLDRRWLERARRSDGAEPLRKMAYAQSPLTMETWEKLRSHLQFCP